MQDLQIDRTFTMKPGAQLKGSFGGLIGEVGRTYYVNNITGNTAYDGLSWLKPKAEVQQAITAAQAYFVLTSADQHVDTSDNQWIRNTIVVQGTSQPYAKITASPDCCTMIGLGTFAGSGGSWGSVARVLSATDTVVGDTRGWSIFNMRFEASGGSAYCIFKVVNSLGMRMEDCSLMSHADNDTTPLHAAMGGMNVVWAGHTIKNCRIGGAGGAQGCSIGIDLGINATTWNNCRISNNIIEGVTYGIKGHPLANAQGTLIDNNHIFGQQFAEGVLANVGIVCSKYLHTAHNFISAADGLSEDSTYQSVGNTIVTS